MKAIPRTKLSHSASFLENGVSAKKLANTKVQVYQVAQVH